jgi:cell pole-organizing protein PopZ
MPEEQKEILESIRDIISGADTGEEVLELTDIIEEAPQPKAAAQPEEKDKDILSEIDALLADEKPASATTEGALDIEFASINIAPKEEFKMPEFEANEPLVSEPSAAAAKDAFQNLLNAAAEKKRSSIEPHPFRNGDTVEDIVAEMLKPLLKEWLDSNLPKMVQNLVEKEIKKLVPAE